MKDPIKGSDLVIYIPYGLNSLIKLDLIRGFETFSAHCRLN